MDDQALLTTWKKRTQRELCVLNHHKGDYTKLAQKRSNDIFKKIKTRIIRESIIALIIIIVMAIALHGYLSFYWIKITTIVIFQVFGFAISARYLFDMSQINDASLADSLGKKADVLKRYIQRLYFSVIPSIAVGSLFVWLNPLKDDEDWYDIVIPMVIAVPVLFWLIKIIKQNIDTDYGNYLRSIQKIYESLRARQ